MLWWSLNIESILQGGWFLLLPRMRFGSTNSASHINMIFLRLSCNFPSWKHIIMHLNASFQKLSEKNLFILFIWGKCNCYVTSTFSRCSFVQPSACHWVETACAIFWLGAGFLLISAEARSSWLCRERKNPTYLRGRSSSLQKGLDFLSGDSQRLWGHQSLNKPCHGQVGETRQHAAELSKVQWALTSAWEWSKPGGCCFT